MLPLTTGLPPCYRIVSNFKKHLLEGEEKDVFNSVQLFVDIETFLSYGTNKKEAQRREQHANLINKYD